MDDDDDERRDVVDWSDYVGADSPGVAEAATSALGRVQAIEHLLSQVRVALASPECRKRRGGSVPPANAEIEALRAQVASLKSQLSSNAGDESLEDLEAALAKAVEALVAGASNEAEIDRLDRAIKAHPDYVSRLARAEREWDDREGPANARAFELQRRLIPADVATSSLSQLEATLEARLAKRIFATRLLWLVWQDVSKTHPSDLHHRYSWAGCDVQEIRAAYHAVRDTNFHNDNDGLKTQWRQRLRAKLVDMVRRVDSLAPHERRRPEYEDAAAPPRRPLRTFNRVKTGAGGPASLLQAIRARHKPTS